MSEKLNLQKLAKDIEEKQFEVKKALSELTSLTFAHSDVSEAASVIAEQLEAINLVLNEVYIQVS